MKIDINLLILVNQDVILQGPASCRYITVYLAIVYDREE